MQKKTKTIINAKRWIIPEVYPGIPENKAINNSLIITQQQSFLSLDLVNYKIYDPWNQLNIAGCTFFFPENFVYGWMII